MAKKSQPDAFDYLSQIKLEFTEKDLVNNPALAKKFIIELKESKAELSVVRDSLESTQNILESQRRDFSELDKKYSVLESKQASKMWVVLLQDIAAATFGAGLGVMFSGTLGVGYAICVPSFVVYIFCRIIISR